MDSRDSKRSYHVTGPIAWMASNSVAANLLMIIFLVGGFIVSTQIKQEVFPEFTTDTIRISVAYPGASPGEVEQGIILSVEDRIRGLDGVKRVTSVAAEGMGSIVVELLESVDANKMVQDVKNEVDGITSFPQDAERPVINLVESRNQVVSLLVYGDQEPTALRVLAEKIRDELIQRPGVTLVELGLAPPLEISIEVSQENLRRYGLTLEQIAAKIRQTAIELPAGEVKTQAGRILLRTQERRDYGKEFKDIPVATTEDGGVVRIGQIADIRDGFQESDEEGFYDGVPAIIVEVYRVGDETPQQVSAVVREYMTELEPNLPEGVGLKVWRDSSERYKERMGLLMKNAIFGLVLVLGLLTLFLEARLAFWVTLGIPISVLGCFLFVPFTGASINMISLFGFIITLGIIVDDAVVTGENIYEKRLEGLSYPRAAIEGAREIAMPVFFAVATNIVAFLPLFFVPGSSGKFFRQIPSIVVAVFFVSLIESLFILPSHLSHELKDRWIWRVLNKPRKYGTRMLESLINRSYVPSVEIFVKYRYATFAAAVATLIAAVGLVAGGHIHFTFLPRIDSDIVTAQAKLPVGVPVEESRRVLKLLIDSAEKTLEKTEGAQISNGIYGQIGRALAGFSHRSTLQFSRGSHLVGAQISLVSSDQREIRATELAKRWREELGKIVGLESLVFKAETGASEGSAIELNLSHLEREVTEKAAADLVRRLETYQGVFDSDDGVASGKRQLSFQVTPEARSLGITANDLGRQVRSAFYGAEALRQQRGRNEIKVMVRLPKEERETLETIERLIVQTPSGGEITFAESAQVEEGRSYTEINRRDGRRVITVTADVDQEIANANDINAQIVAKDIPALKQKYPGLGYSVGGEREAQSDSLGALGIGFVIVLLVIYALLAIPFKSYVQPLIVMLSIPFGIIGAVGGHFLLGYGLSMISLFGVIALSGVVVNDSLVLVVTANRLREQGVSAVDAIKQAGIRRFRPILLTSLTTFFGLAPMIFETSVQARFLIPMAISIGFGILFATVIILAIVPAIYLIVEDIKQRFSPLADPGQGPEQMQQDSSGFA